MGRVHVCGASSRLTEVGCGAWAGAVRGAAAGRGQAAAAAAAAARPRGRPEAGRARRPPRAALTPARPQALCGCMSPRGLTGRLRMPRGEQRMAREGGADVSLEDRRFQCLCGGRPRASVESASRVAGAGRQSPHPLGCVLMISWKLCVCICLCVRVCLHAHPHARMYDRSSNIYLWILAGVAQ